MLNDDQKWYKVSLRFFGEGLDVSSVAAKIGFKPDVVGRLGEHIRGNPRYALYETNLWVHRYTDDDALPLDRKSTRLNSSHLVISYAVFCLKKKIPYGSTLFLFIFTMNFVGFIPLPLIGVRWHGVPTWAIYAVTSKLCVTLVLAVLTVDFAT